MDVEARDNKDLSAPAVWGGIRGFLTHAIVGAATLGPSLQGVEQWAGIVWPREAGRERQGGSAFQVAWVLAGP